MHSTHIRAANDVTANVNDNSIKPLMFQKKEEKK